MKISDISGITLRLLAETLNKNVQLYVNDYNQTYYIVAQNEVDPDDYSEDLIFLEDENETWVDKDFDVDD